MFYCQCHPTVEYLENSLHRKRCLWAQRHSVRDDCATLFQQGNCMSANISSSRIKHYIQLSGSLFELSRPIRSGIQNPVLGAQLFCPRNLFLGRRCNVHLSTSCNSQQKRCKSNSTSNPS